MITGAMLHKALKENIIQLKTTMESEGVFCQIGEYSFYFDSLAETFDSPEDYKAMVSTSHIVNKIAEALERLNNKRTVVIYNYIENYINYKLYENKPATLYDIKNESGRYIIPVSWAVYSTITVEADSLGDAVDIAKEKMDDIPLCTDGVEYVDGSYSIDIETDEDAENAQSYMTLGNVTIHKNGEITE